MNACVFYSHTFPANRLRCLTMPTRRQGSFRNKLLYALLALMSPFCFGDRHLVAETPAEAPAKVTIFTGHDGPFHKWQETSAALQEALAAGKDFQVAVQTDVEWFVKPELLETDLVVLNYCNWDRPGLSDAGKMGLLKYLAAGKGLAIVHFANGAFQAALPCGPKGDWPEYRKICRRNWVWGKSGHDALGRFEVKVVDGHPITKGLNSFHTVDELYCRQVGDEPITVLAVAACKTTGREEPQAFVYNYDKARVFQTTLGHSAESIRNPGAAALIRRGSLWAAGKL